MSLCDHDGISGFDVGFHDVDGHFQLDHCQGNSDPLGHRVVEEKDTCRSVGLKRFTVRAEPGLDSQQQDNSGHPGNGWRPAGVTVGEQPPWIDVEYLGYQIHALLQNAVPTLGFSHRLLVNTKHPGELILRADGCGLVP